MGERAQAPSHRVVANLGRALAVAPLDGGEVIRAMPLRQLPLIVAGDLITVEHQGHAAGTSIRATTLAPRASVLQRFDHRGRSKPLAANLTHLGIVMADPPGLDTLLVDQFCIAAVLAGLVPIVIVNKLDLVSDEQRVEVDTLLKDYRQAGHAAIATDARSGTGLDALRDELVGHAAALVGASGVGKSSLIQRLLPDREIRVGAVSAATGLGAHTTSVTFWYDLPSGGSIVDSPGVRQYSVAELSAREVRDGYVDIARAAAGCRFNDCTHDVEPDCAVQAAVERGDIADWRFANYRKLAGLA